MHPERSKRSIRIIFAIVSTLTIVSLSFGGAVILVKAQFVDAWSNPDNLSNSGSANNPVFVIGSDGVIHALWMDEYAGLVQISGDGEEWDVPTPIILPSVDVVPTLIADGHGIIHALWRDEESRLFYSRVRETAFSNSASWSPRVLISEAALDFDIALDDNGDLHLSYINPLDTELSPAGVYYRRLRNGTSIWLNPSILYTSPYFRTLDLESSNVSISTSVSGEDTRIFVAWDNRPRERVFLAFSDDNGETWSGAEEVDQPETGQVNSGPAGIKIHSNGDEEIRFWRVGDRTSICNHFYQVSKDRGETWNVQQPIFDSSPLCFDEVQFIDGDEFPVLIGKADQVYFLAWDGEKWSEPQPQEAITSFIDPDTQKLVRLGCSQAILDGNGVLSVIGCDEEKGGDIWILQRQMNDIGNWFPIESGWGTIEEASSSPLKLASPRILAGNNSRIHLFWVQSETQDPSSLGKEIYYSGRQEGQWSTPSAILSSPTGKADQVSVAMNPTGQLFVVWSGGHGGEIYFSQADSDRASVAASWSEPIKLPALVQVGSSPDIIVDHIDNLHVAYAVPLNEQRGIYFTNSYDLGHTWINPVQVFDAQGALWDMVENPVLSVTKNGDLHIIWTRYSLPSGEGPLELYYAKSQDSGETWSSPQLVVEGPVVWSQVLGVGDHTVQRLWQQESASGSTLWHEQSTDGGLTWERIAPVTIFGEILGNPSLSSDSAGRLHLLLTVQSGIDSYLLQHWLFDGQSWTAESSNSFQFSPGTEINSISSNISDDGLLAVALLNSNFPISGNGEYQLTYTDFSMDVPVVESTPITESINALEDIPTQIPTPLATDPAQPTIQSTPTQISFPDETDSPGNTSWLMVAGPVVIGLIALVVIVLVVRWIRR